MNFFNYKPIRLIYLFLMFIWMFLILNSVHQENIGTTIIVIIFISIFSWSFLINHLFYLRFNDLTGIVYKFMCFRKINLSVIKEVTYELEHSRYEFIFGQTIIMKLRKKKGLIITIPFAKKDKFNQFKNLIEERTNLKVTKESEYLRNKKQKYK